MKIGLDFINLNLSNLGGGLGRFALQLINGLAAIDKKNEYVLFMNAEVASQINISNPKFSLCVVKTPHRRYAPWNQIYFALNRGKLGLIDILHSPVTPSPLLLFKKVKTIVTLHDLAWKFFPNTFRRIGVIWWSVAWFMSLKQSAHIVVDSESTKRDVIKFYNIPEDKITIIYPYVPLNFLNISLENLSAVRKEYNLPEKYILSVGVSHKRKNLNSLIRAFEILKKEKHIPHKLVLTGPRGWGSKVFAEEIKALNLQEEVFFTESISDADLPLVYRAADVFVFPSLYEGFGYPPLEAMACGTPVVVSNNSSLPEVVGQAGLYIDPDSLGDIADKIFQIISSPDLVLKLRELGFQQAKKFTMEKMIEKYIEVYTKYGQS